MTKSAFSISLVEHTFSSVIVTSDAMSKQRQRIKTNNDDEHFRMIRKDVNDWKYSYFLFFFFVLLLSSSPTTHLSHQHASTKSSISMTGLLYHPSRRDPSDDRGLPLSARCCSLHPSLPNLESSLHPVCLATYSRKHGVTKKETKILGR